MKKTLLLIMLAFIVSAANAQFHVRVECFGDRSDPKFQEYIIKFTGDNWKTSNEIMEAFDLSDPDITPFNVCYQEMIFISMDTAKDEAIGFARQLTSLKICQVHNANVFSKYQRLLTYRKSHPFKNKITIREKKACCRVEQIY